MFNNKANIERFSLLVDSAPQSGLQVLGFQGRESISNPFYFEVTLVNKFIRFDITTLLNKTAYLTFTHDQKQGVHGVIISVSRGPVGLDYAEYTITLAPSFTHLEKRTNQRIFQQQTVPQIITQILSEYGIAEGAQHEFKLKESYTPRDYCVQYNETDAYFIQRLCEEEGIHYHFQHKKDNHMMVFADGNPTFPSLKNVIYRSHSGLSPDEEVVKAFDVSLSSKTTSATWRDYNFTNVKIPEGTTVGLQSAKANGAEEPDTEFYAYPVGAPDNAQAKHLAKIEIERLRALHVLAKGYSDVARLHAGHGLIVEEHPSLDVTEPWILNTVIHQGKQPQVIEALGGAELKHLRASMPNLYHPFIDEEFHQGYRNFFEATPKDVPWRPARLHPKLKIFGSQTAKVTGPSGEEIYCDEYGRVKAQFHWDREGKFDENSSCWMRVASNWAHKSYGAVTIPRVGMEVLITFLEGDPDQPLITGCVHNGINTNAYQLPAHKTRTVFKTNSSKGGGGYNEVRIEDAKGKEEIYIQAERDYNHLTKHDRTKTIGNDETNKIIRHRETTVGGNHTEHVKKNQSITIDENHTEHVKQNQSITVNKDQTEKIDGNQSLQVIKNQTEQVNKNKKLQVTENYDQQVSKNKSTNVKHEVKYVAGDRFEIVCGKSSILMEKNGHVTIKGSEFLFKTTGAQFHKATGNIEMKAKKILEN